MPLEELPPPSGGDRVVTPGALRAALPPRSFDLHKGGAGRVGIVAGSRGMWGASLLCAAGALRGGAGLVTLYVREEDYPLVLAAGPPAELMVKPVGSLRDVLAESLDALAVGPGLGMVSGEGREVLRDLLREFAGPIVVDADALNFLAREGTGDLLRERMLVTPHPGEMERLFPEVAGAGLGRAEIARRFVERHRCTLLYKGARTIVTAPGEVLSYNSTGTPGMASGGQGDVLSGLLAALLARGLAPLEAARAGAWLAGRSSELALAREVHAEESLLAGDTARFLGAAFRALREDA